MKKPLGIFKKYLKLHMPCEVKKVLVSFRKGKFNKVKEAEYLLKNVEGSVFAEDRKYWIIRLMKKIEKNKTKGR
ncbi:MAG: hypothetical protein J7K69_01775 [Thermotogae bacterium]|nr:hypothetical protein [Thermotogota bacterium]